MSNSMSLGEGLKKYRKLRGFTQMQICNKLKISQASISQIETGRHWPHQRHLKQLLKLYQLELRFHSLIPEKLEL